MDLLKALVLFIVFLVVSLAWFTLRIVILVGPYLFLLALVLVYATGV